MNDVHAPDKNRLHDLPLYRLCLLTGTQLVTGQYAEITQDGKLGRKLANFDSSLFEVVHVSPELNMIIYKVKTALPRAYFPQKWEAGTNQSIKKCILNPSDVTALPGDIGYVLGSEVLAAASSFEQLFDTSPAKIGSVSWVHDGSEEIELKTETDQARLLVLSDTLYPGWTATVDRQPVPIVTANLFNRAVVVPKGTHTVKFVFSPQSLNIGIWLAVLAAVLLAIALTLLRDRQAD